MSAVGRPGLSEAGTEHQPDGGSGGGHLPPERPPRGLPGLKAELVGRGGPTTRGH